MVFTRKIKVNEKSSLQFDIFVARRGSSETGLPISQVFSVEHDIHEIHCCDAWVSRQHSLAQLVYIYHQTISLIILN
jgi:hypothetical protein